MQEAICDVCMHHCKIFPGEWGFCRARKNENGKIVCGNYGQLTSLALDPIEKKPLNRFYPGSLILSAGSFGCNLRCPFCQNHEISMAGKDDIRTEYYSPEELVTIAKECEDRGNIGIAFTYNEPLVSWEYIRDTSERLRQAGMKSVLVTNGSASLSVLESILPFVDAMNIDVKGFREKYYKSLGGSLETVKKFVERAAQGCHVELTTLIVPGENDSPDEMEEEAAWIASVRRDIPLHVTRFFPRYKWKEQSATNIKDVYQLAETARKYLAYVYEGNC